MKLTLKPGLRAVFALAAIFAALFFGCKKSDITTASPVNQSLLHTIAADPDFKPVAYMLNRDYLQLRMDLHDSSDKEGRAKELIRAANYMAAYGYKLQQKYKLGNIIATLLDAAKVYNEQVYPTLAVKMKQAIKARETLVKTGTKPRLAILDCPSGLLFNPELEMCDWPENCPEGADPQFILTDDGTMLPLVTVTSSCYDRYDMTLDMLRLMCRDGYEAVFGDASSADRRSIMISNSLDDDCYGNQFAYIDLIFDKQFEHDHPSPPDPLPSGDDGSGGGGGGGDDGSGEGGTGGGGGIPNIVVNLVSDPCKNDALVALTNKNIENMITKFYNDYLIPNSSNLKLLIKEGSVAGGGLAVTNPVAYAPGNWQITLSNSPVYNGSAMSKEAWGVVIAHEILHIIIGTSPTARPTDDNYVHHSNMFFNYTNTIKNYKRCIWYI